MDFRFYSVNTQKMYLSQRICETCFWKKLNFLKKVEQFYDVFIVLVKYLYAFHAYVLCSRQIIHFDAPTLSRVYNIFYVFLM